MPIQENHSEGILGKGEPRKTPDVDMVIEIQKVGDVRNSEDKNGDDERKIPHVDRNFQFFRSDAGQSSNAHNGQRERRDERQNPVVKLQTDSDGTEYQPEGIAVCGGTKNDEQNPHDGQQQQCRQMEEGDESESGKNRRKCFVLQCLG